MEALKQAVTNLDDVQIEHFKNEEKMRRELEFREFKGLPASQKLSKGEKKRAKRDRRKGYV